MRLFIIITIAIVLDLHFGADIMYQHLHSMSVIIQVGLASSVVIAGLQDLLECMRD